MTISNERNTVNYFHSKNQSKDMSTFSKFDTSNLKMASKTFYGSKTRNPSIL